MSLIAVAPAISTATPVAYLSDDPKITTKLRDGREVPFGPGVICTTDCPEIEFSLNRTGKRRAGLIVLSVAAVGTTLIILSRPRGGEGPPVRAPAHPGVDVIEVSTLILLGTGLLFLAIAIQKKGKYETIRRGLRGGN